MIRVVNWVLRLGLGAVFIFAGTLKILDPAAFAADITHYRLIPEQLANLMAIALPWLEVVGGLCLVTGVWPRAAALVLGALCLVFLVAIVQALVRGLDIRCGCYGTIDAEPIGARKLVENFGLLLAAAWLVWRERK